MEISPVLPAVVFFGLKATQPSVLPLGSSAQGCTALGLPVVFSIGRNNPDCLIGVDLYFFSKTESHFSCRNEQKKISLVCLK